MASAAASSSWAPRPVAVLGGDTREHEVITAFTQLGCEVRTFGVPPHPEHDALRAPDPLAAVRGVDVIVTPVPGIGDGDVLFAPSTETPIAVTAELLGAANQGAVFFSGRATPTIERNGADNGLRFVHLYDDDELQILHAIPTAEGAIAYTVRETEDVLNGARALVVGYGRIAKVLADRLRGMGVAVTVAARRADMRALAHALGCDAVGTDEGALAEAVATQDLVYNTVPAPVIGRIVLERVRADAYVLDLAAPPGGVDREAATELGVRHGWARGQAGTAPRHSGRAQFQSMARSLEALFGDDR